MRAERGGGRGRSGQECGCGWMREEGGAGAQEWEGGGLDALRGAGGWGRGLEGEAPEATRGCGSSGPSTAGDGGRGRQQADKHTGFQ